MPRIRTRDHSGVIPGPDIVLDERLPNRKPLNESQRKAQRGAIDEGQYEAFVWLAEGGVATDDEAIGQAAADRLRAMNDRWGETAIRSLFEVRAFHHGFREHIASVARRKTERDATLQANPHPSGGTALSDDGVPRGTEIPGMDRIREFIRMIRRSVNAGAGLDDTDPCRFSNPAIAFVVLVAKAVVLQILWFWFVAEEMRLPQLSTATAFGILVAFHMVSDRPLHTGVEKSMAARLGWGLASPLLALCLGAVGMLLLT